MGILTILAIIFLFVLSFIIPIIGIPLLIITIVGVAVFKIVKGTAKATYKGIKWVAKKKPPKVPGTRSESICPACGGNLMVFPNDTDLWCPSCRKWLSGTEG